MTTNQESHWGGDTHNQTKIRQSNISDQRAFQEAMRSHYSDTQSQSWAISQAYRYLKILAEDWLNGAPEERTSKADALEEAITKHLQVAVIDLDEEEKPHIIFETLNARGEPLKESDLVKNTVMYEADVIDDPDKARQLWGMFNDEWWRQNTSEGRYNRIHIDRFLNYWIIMRKSKDVTANRVAAEFRIYIETKNKPGEQSPIEHVAADIRNAGKIYQDLEELRVPGYETFLTRIKGIELGVITPVLLWLYASKISPEQLRRSIDALESYVMRRMLCGFQSQGLNKVFISLLEKLGSHNVEHADDIIVNYLHSQNVENRWWPNDRTVHQSLTTSALKGKDARKKMVLVAIEMKLRTDKSEPLGATDKLTVEHIMPKKWEKNWPIPTDVLDRTEAEEERKESIKNIGNLTLTTGKLNASLSNGPWTEKREALRKHSSLFLNKTLLDDVADVWNETAILKRSACLAETIMQIWPSADTFAESPTLTPDG